MSPISVWFIRAALLHFGVGATIGAWQLAATTGLFGMPPLALRGAHVELVLLGWVTQLAFGVALWILPFSRGVSRQRRVWVAWVALNGGIAIVAGAQVVGLPLAIIVGRILEVGAALLVASGLWGRVRPLPRAE